MDGKIVAQGTLSGDLRPADTLSGNLGGTRTLRGGLSVPSSVNGPTNYESLKNKPQIESVELVGNKTFEDLGLETIDNSELMELLTF